MVVLVPTFFGQTEQLNAWRLCRIAMKNYAGIFQSRPNSIQSSRAARRHTVSAFEPLYCSQIDAGAFGEFCRGYPEQGAGSANLSGRNHCLQRPCVVFCDTNDRANWCSNESIERPTPGIVCALYRSLFGAHNQGSRLSLCVRRPRNVALGLDSRAARRDKNKIATSPRPYRWKYDRPPSLREFTAAFPDDAACVDWLVRNRWPDGFTCPGCDWRNTWAQKNEGWQVPIAKELPMTILRQWMTLQGYAQKTLDA